VLQVDQNSKMAEKTQSVHKAKLSWRQRAKAEDSQSNCSVKNVRK